MSYEGFVGTLTYSESVNGWPSFYSFEPEFMIGMNNYFYTFKAGNLYRHNSASSNRNTFYLDYWIRLNNPGAAFTPSSISGVFNESVLENKLFKTIIIEGTEAWELTDANTDSYQQGYIALSWFEKKESSYFSFIRNVYGEQSAISAQINFRNLSGIGNSITVDTGSTLIAIDFSINPLVTFSSLSVGDYMLFYENTEVKVAGVVSAININYPLGINRILVSSQITPFGNPDLIVNNVNYFLYAKNFESESQGILGHYSTFELTNYSDGPIQLFTIGAEVMKSFP
jgi:hypothetical protein